MLLAETSDSVLIWQAVIGGLVAVALGYLQLRNHRAIIDASVAAKDVSDKATIASDKADASHKIVSDIKDLAVRTETQTNNRLSMLDAKVAEHERKCVENMRLIAELKLQLAEALRNKS